MLERIVHARQLLGDGRVYDGEVGMPRWFVYSVEDGTFFTGYAGRYSGLYESVDAFKGSVGTAPGEMAFQDHWEEWHAYPRGVWHLGVDKRAYANRGYEGAWELEFIENHDHYENRHGMIIAPRAGWEDAFDGMISTLKTAGKRNREATRGVNRPSVVECEKCGVDVPVGEKGRLPRWCAGCRGLNAQWGKEGELAENRRLRTVTCLACETVFENAKKQRLKYCVTCRASNDSGRDASLRRRFGPEVGLPTIRRLSQLQGGNCAICVKPLSDFIQCVDHDHETGKVRGLLCHHCNRSLGTFGDNLEGIMKVAEYLKRPPMSDIS